MNKKVIILKEGDKIVDIYEVVTFVDFEQYKKIVEEAQKNKEEIEKARKEEQEREKLILNGKLHELEVNLIDARNEISLLRGRITEEEYEERKQELWNIGK